ncbi:hypothetical protein [Providencia sp. PROV060]|uniref:hypothetical protein n=1 Tax=Providencia sp. PROV060 TaxID=2949788 RepID=UPI00234B7F2F|nr:hypothetical protein [Providencia sp. PROV060]EJD6045561.1 hypothetical protein [Providencia rettgeri]EJD6049630.1 hypothetical protein [Providencia rettgeri]ELR5103432.1 hypothetical protein [Providencia rettgeri]MDI7244466.1 hypothetical protein [Providencia rettgeri]
MSTSSFSIENLIKIHAKFFAKAKNMPLNKAYNELAIKNHFENYHEVVKVLNKNRNDPRIHKLAFQYDYGLDDLINPMDIYSDINFYLEDVFSSEMASMNAYDFSCDYNSVTFDSYDENTGVLLLNVDLDFSGDADPDRPYSGHIIYAEIRLALNKTKDGWELNTELSEVLESKDNTQLPGFYDDDY